MFGGTIVAPDRLGRRLSKEMRMNRKRGAATQQHGFTTMQLIVVIMIISVISVFGVLGIARARADFRLQNSARVFASYIEKARVDSIRRHAPDGSESWIETFGPGSTTYAVTMDFGSGALETRTFSLEDGLSFQTTAKKISFNWRGRISEAWVFQIFSNYLQRSLPVDVSGSGDITVGEQHFPDQLIPPVEVTQVMGDVDSDPSPSPSAEPPPPIEETPGGDTIDPTPTPTPSPEHGNGTPAGGNDGSTGSDGTPGNDGTGNPNASPSPTPPEEGSNEVPACAATISPDRLELSQSASGRQSGTVTFTMVNSIGVRTISASQAGQGNALNLDLSLLRIDGNGSSVLTVTTKQGGGNRGEFIVNVSASPACGTTQKLTVSVSN